jgi:hypothetical protein
VIGHTTSDFSGPDYVLRTENGRYVASFDRRAAVADRVVFTPQLASAKRFHRTSSEIVEIMSQPAFDCVAVELIKVDDAKAGEA